MINLGIRYYPLCAILVEYDKTKKRREGGGGYIDTSQGPDRP